MDFGDLDSEGGLARYLPESIIVGTKVRLLTVMPLIPIYYLEKAFTQVVDHHHQEGSSFE